MFYMNNRTFVVMKEWDVNNDIEKHKKDLIVTPEVDMRYTYKRPPSFRIFKENETKIYLPRYYGLKYYNMLDKLDRLEIKMPKSTEINVPFNGELRENQIKPIKKTLETFKKCHGGVLSLNTGFGKTTCALYIASVMKKKTLVIVHKEFLMEQWKRRIEQFLPTARIGKIQRDSMDVEDKDIVLGMLQSIALKDYPQSIFKGIGLVVIDECFPSNQHVITDKGPVGIAKLYLDWTKNKYNSVLSFNETEKTFEWKQITHAWKKKSDKLINFFCNKEKITCTENHEFLTIDGYKRAKDLQIDDLLISYQEQKIVAKSLNYGTIKVTSEIKYLEEEKNVYDIEVKDNHNFVICSIRGESGPVVHNCHHINSEHFSRALFKIGSEYTLGLSATPNRPDKLERVFEWHAGPIIHESKIEPRGLTPIIHFYNYSLDPDPRTKAFVELLNFKQNPNITGMITTLTNSVHRNAFIISKIKKVLERDPERNVLVLSDRRHHIIQLKEFLENDDSFNHSVGLYMGQMKRSDLDESENAQIIFGTINMVKEGFDIPRLDTLVLTTPKSDVNQIVGRILRKDHKEKPPLIIDIADQYSAFTLQGYKRKHFYNSREYKIYNYTIHNNNEVTKSKGKKEATIDELPLARISRIAFLPSDDEDS